MERLKASLKAKGLQKTQEDYDGMERLLSGLSFWSEVKSEADKLFADERKRMEDLELARAKASAPQLIQIMPSATTGVSMTSPQFQGSMYEIKDNDNVNFGGESNG